MDYYTILAQRAQLTRLCAGKRIGVIRRSGDYTVFAGLDHGPALKLAAIPDMPYLTTIDPAYLPRRGAKPWHQNRFEGRTMESIDIITGDRVLMFTMDNGTRLIFELTGRHANIVITGPDRTITGVLRPVPAAKSSVREVVPGSVYEPPPHRDCPDLVWSQPAELDSRLDDAGGTVREAMQRGLACGSRLFAGEACARAGIPPDAVVSELDYDDRHRLYAAAAKLASQIESGGGGGTVILRADGLPRDVFPLPLTDGPDGSEHYDDLFEAVTAYARTREVELERRSLRNGIMSALAAEEKRIRRTMARVERERGADDEPGRLEGQANTILANLHRIPRGASTVALEDLTTGEPVDIELDPALDGPANARRLFKRAKKLRAAAELAASRHAELNRRLETIVSDRETAEQLDDLRELKVFAARYAPVQQRRDSAGEETPFPRRYTSPAGLEIIVGRNDRENDELVRWAKKTDLWLHAQYIGGSHVILRTPGRQNADRESIERAAAIAAYYSKGKTQSLVPVVCSEVKYVTKRKGMGPGKVHYIRERVLFVEPRHRWDR